MHFRIFYIPRPYPLNASISILLVPLVYVMTQIAPQRVLREVIHLRVKNHFVCEWVIPASP